MNDEKKIKIKFTPALANGLLIIFVGISVWLIFEFVEKERNRDLLNWQSHLALLAEIKSTAVENWIEERKNKLNKLAENTSLRLFLSEYNNRDKVDKTVLSALRGHVRNLLRSSAEKFGFSGGDDKVNNLNINYLSEYGIAILGGNHKPVMSTKGFPKNIEMHKDVIDKAYKAALPQVIEIYSGQKQQPVFGYIVPVFKVQNLDNKDPLGVLVLLLNPYNNLYDILKNAQSVTESDESLLIRDDGSNIVYISPLKGGYKIFHRLSDNSQLASSFAYHNPGGFDEMVDYYGNNVLVTGRKIKNSSWGLVQKISVSEALAESNKHQNFLLTTFILIVMIIALSFIAIWRHSTGIRLKILSDELERRTALLNAVADNIKDKIVLLDDNLKVVYINIAFTQALGVDEEEIKSKHISSVLGKEASELLLNSSYADSKPSVKSLQINACERIYHVTFTRLISSEYTSSGLYVLHDISDLKHEQKKREKLARGIIGTLVKAVDLHDPYCLNHSTRTRDVAMEIAKEMALSTDRMESLEMASLLANIGKLFVPKEILTKMDALSVDESSQLKKHIEFAVDILSELSFNGPVVEIISQKNERLDGSGYPKGLVESEIMLESRILAVANAFVAMASSRAYREGHAVKDVVDILIEQSGTLYDRHVVAALFHISENKADWKTWQST